nr:unnamed protein product [Callosobruchus chinensis]
MKTSCLVEEGDEIALKKNHSYYYQCQMQIFVTNLKYCDFVIWSPHIFFKKRILPDLQFWEENKNIALKFHKEIVMPELLGRYFTKKEGTAKVIQWCLCKSVDDGRPMIKCDGDDCPTEWFILNV